MWNGFYLKLTYLTKDEFLSSDKHLTRLFLDLCDMVPNIWFGKSDLYF